MTSSWDYWSRYNSKRWKPLEAIDDIQFYKNYNGSGGGVDGRSIIALYHQIIGKSKRAFISTSTWPERGVA